MAALRIHVLPWLRGTHEHVTELVQRTAPHLPPALRPLLHDCLMHVTASDGVADLAVALRWHRNTLASRLARAKGPTPERFRAWCLLLWIGYLLDETSSSIEGVALALGFSSASAVSHLVSRYVSMSPTLLRAEGALRLITSRFAAECAGADA